MSDDELPIPKERKVYRRDEDVEVLVRMATFEANQINQIAAVVALSKKIDQMAMKADMEALRRDSERQTHEHNRQAEEREKRLGKLENQHSSMQGSIMALRWALGLVLAVASVDFARIWVH